MLHPALRSQLRGSVALLTGWQRVVPSVSHKPLTRPLTIAIARTMAANGCCHLAVSILTAFDGLLRVGELVRIAVADVSMPHDSRRGGSLSASCIAMRLLRLSTDRRSCNRAARPFGCVAPRPARSRQRRSATVTSPLTLLQHHIATRPAGGLLFDLSSSSAVKAASHLRSVMRSMCHALDLGSLHFTPHSLRHGGATHAYMYPGDSIDTVLLRGRWRSNASARTYLQLETAALISSQPSEQAQQCAHGVTG